MIVNNLLVTPPCRQMLNNERTQPSLPSNVRKLPRPAPNANTNPMGPRLNE